MMRQRKMDRTDSWYQMHEIHILLGEKDKAWAETIAKAAESRGEGVVRIAERLFLDGTKVYDVYVVKE